MKQIVASLNEMYPELGLNVENVTDNIDALSAKIMETAEQTYKKRKVENAQNVIVEQMGMEDSLKRELETAQNELYQVNERFSKQIEGAANLSWNPLSWLSAASSSIQTTFENATHTGTTEEF